MISNNCKTCEYFEYCNAKVFVDTTQHRCFALLAKKPKIVETCESSPSIPCDKCSLNQNCPYEMADECSAWRQAFRQQHTKENRLDIRGKDFSTRSKRHHARKQDLPVPYIMTVGNMDSVRWGDDEYGVVVGWPDE